MELSLDTTHEAVDWVCTLLAEMNDIGDVRIAEYIEPNLPHLRDRDIAQPDWTFTIRFYYTTMHIRGNVRKKSLICSRPCTVQD
jgi:ribosomal protein L11 methyltransferase